MQKKQLKRPLEGLTVLDFSQFLSGPSAALRLSDLGARVIKVEKTGTGDICRTLYISNLKLDGDSTLFHSINRNKEGISIDLKDPDQLQLIEEMIKEADILIENFRPGVMEKLGLDYQRVKEINPKIVYGEITGYGNEGPWRTKPGQDLLVQAISGVTWVNGNCEQPPVPIGLSVVDMIAGAQLVQGILAALIQKNITGKGSYVQISLLEAILDLQIELITTYLNDGAQLPKREQENNAHVYLSAPYGIYQTKDGYLALAMGSVTELSRLLDCEQLSPYQDQDSWYQEREEIKAILSSHLQTNTTKHWLSILESDGFWCSEVFTWTELLQHEGFKHLNFIQEITRRNGSKMLTTRCPIRIDGEILTSPKGAPAIGEDNEFVLGTLLL
jgi:CoA:oxalate CoA-transferase